MALGAMAEDNDDPDFTKSLTEAVRLRSEYLRGQADHLTLPEVRRLLERDLGLRTSELDVHKALIRKLVDKVLNDGEDATKVIEKPRKRRKNNARVVDDDGEPETEKPQIPSTEKKRKLSEDVKDVQKTAASVDDELSKNPNGNQALENEVQDNGSQVSEAKPDPVEEKQNEVFQSGSNVDENSIREAFIKRADELKAQAESITVTHVRRLLEEDLGLELNKLDAHKPFIRNLVDELLESTSGGPAKASDDKDATKKVVKGKTKVKAPNVEPGEQGDADSTGSDSEGSKKRKVSKKKSPSGKKKTEKEGRKAPEPKRPFGPEVERLRELCKTIELGIPPAAYAKAKQAPEDERDEVLVKELENVLGRVGCPPNPSPNDIRRVKAQLRKKRDLDGIDNTNIVSEPRRSRASANSWFTPKPTNRYLEDKKKTKKTSEVQDSDDEGRPKITGPMED